MGEANVINILKIAEESHVEKIKLYIIDKATSKFELSNNFFRAKRVNYRGIHHNLCFAVIIFQLKKYFTLSYKCICEDLQIKPRNNISFYYGKLNTLNEKNTEDIYYIDLIAEIDKDIKAFVEKTIKNNNNGKDE